MRVGFVAMVISPKENRAYLASRKTNRVFVIDPAAERCPAGTSERDCYVLSSIGADDGLDAGPDSLAITPDGRHLYVGHSGENRVTVLDTSKMEPQSEDPAGPVHHVFTCIPYPLGIDVHPAGERAYVGRRQLITLFPEPCEERDLSDPATLLSFLADAVDVLEIEGDEGPAITATVPLLEPNTFPFVYGLGDPEKIVFTPDGKRAYVILQDSGSIGVVGTDRADPETHNKLSAIIRVGRRPVDIVIRPQGDFAFVAHGGTDRLEVWSPDSVSVLVIDDLSNPQAFSIPDVGFRPEELRLSDDGNRLYVPVPDFGRDPRLQVIDADPASDSFARILRTIRLPRDRFPDFLPWKVRVSPDGRFAIVIPAYSYPSEPDLYSPWGDALFLDELVLLPLD